MKNEKQEILKAIKENKLYYYITNNYWKLERETINDLLKEVIFLFNTEEKTINETLQENLKDVCGWEE